VDRLARCAEMCSEHAEAVTLLRELADGYRGAAQDGAAHDRAARDGAAQESLAGAQRFAGGAGRHGSFR